MAPKKPFKQDDDDMDEEEDIFADDDGEEVLFPELSDRQVDDELRLPSALAATSRKEKRKLLLFKRSNNVRDYEVELVQRQDALSKKLDLERLKRMTGKAEDDDEPVTTRRTSARSKAKAPAAKQRRRQVEEEDEDEGEDEDEAAASEDEDQLFDSDEEREISEKNRSGLLDSKGKDVKRKATQKKSAPVKRGRWDTALDSDENYEEDEEEGDDEEPQPTRKREEPVVEDTSGEAGPQDLHGIIARRTDVEININEPFFKDWVTGQFVRFPKPDNGNILEGRKVYALSEVTDVQEGGREYKLHNGKVTSKRLVVTTGQFTHTLKITLLSDTATIPKDGSSR